MEVVAVSIGQLTWWDINGVRTLTSIVREPSAEPLELTVADGIVGNASAAHDAQVYAFFAHHYDYWCQRLGVDRSSWKWCHWGENITFRCVSTAVLDERRFHLGDVWAVGESVRLQVCGSRVPCTKLSWRCGQNDRWLRTLADTGYCGVYLRVLQGGRVRPGDEARPVQICPLAMDCATISRLAFDSSLKTRDTVNLLLNDRNLLGMNQRYFRRKLSLMNDQANVGRNAWKGWRAFKATRIVGETGGEVKSFYLVPVDGKSLATYLPGQFLTVRLPAGTVRNWTISDWTSASDPSYYRISIKKATDASRWMYEKCTTDSLLLLRPPAGGFCLDWTPLFPPRQVYISAGIGITPMIAMIKAHAAHTALRMVPALWIHVARNQESCALWEELSDLEFDRDENEDNGKDYECPLLFQRVLFYTAPKTACSSPPSSSPSSPSSPASSSLSASSASSTSPPSSPSSPSNLITVHIGRPTLPLLSSLLTPSYAINPLHITPITIPGPHSTFYICGPPSFIPTMTSHLISLSVPPALIHSETFDSTVDPIASTSNSVEESTVHFSHSNITATWRREDGNLSLLEVAEKAGLAPEYGCRLGECGACRVRLVEGDVSGGRAGGGGEEILVCRARPACRRVVVEI